MSVVKDTVAAKLMSVNIGRAAISQYKGKEAVSGIEKKPVVTAVLLGITGLEGDEQADLVNHGGPDKAACVYSRLHYPHWESVLGRELADGAFGENFTVDGLAEDEVRVGDIFEIGSAVVQVSQPRQPCWKLAMKWGLDELPKLVSDKGATGFYFRVLKPGEVNTGDSIVLTNRHPDGITVAEANRIMHWDKSDKEGIRRLLAVDALSASWVSQLTSRLARLESESLGKSSDS